MGSNLLNHDAMVGIGQTKKRQRRKKQRKPKGRLHQTQVEQKQYRK